MSLTVKHLNADSSFLLTFSPEAQPLPTELTSAHGAFTVLVDPWLTGASIVSASWFACTTLNVPPCIQHLSEIEEPDVVIVSQNKPDHCHEKTLRQLNPEGKTIIAAEPGAAKAIKKWKYFDPHRVIGLPKYNPKEKFSSLRIPVPPLSPSGQPGEVVISFIPARNYTTGLHNAIGITYQPPTHLKNLAVVPTVELTRRTPYFHMPMSPKSLPPRSPPQVFSPMLDRPASAIIDGQAYYAPPEPPTSSLKVNRPPARSSRTGSSDFLPFQQMPVVHPSPKTSMSSEDDSPSVPLPSKGSAQGLNINIPVIFEPETSSKTFFHALPTPPESPSYPLAAARSYHHSPSLSNVSQKSSISTGSTVTPGRPRPVSVLYSPHGIPFSPDLLPYVQHHLVKLGALPLTLLLHAFDHVQNPWYLGGNIMTGFSGGLQIAQGLMARCWLSAHDEAKDDRGVSVSKLRTTRMSAQDLRKKLWEGKEGDFLRKRGWQCDVRSLGVGAEMFIGPARDLLVGMEDTKESPLLSFG